MESAVYKLNGGDISGQSAASQARDRASELIDTPSRPCVQSVTKDAVCEVGEMNGIRSSTNVNGTVRAVGGNSPLVPPASAPNAAKLTHRSVGTKSLSTIAKKLRTPAPLSAGYLRTYQR